ncbi:MAG: IS30 family transposase, partial [Celeribacter sp.]
MMFPLERSIHNRPEHIKDRSTFGDWEGDLMIFRREHGKANVASLVERKTRYAVLFRNNDRSSTHFMAGPVPLSCRSDYSFMRPFVRKPRDFSSRVLSVFCGRYRSHLC